MGTIQRMWDTDRPVVLVIKELSDRVLAFVLLVFLSPLMLLLALLIRLESRGPVFYKQERVGWRNKIFVMIKFRSMTEDAEKDGPRAASAGDARITRFGYFMRVTHLDELPQLWNILKGEMSFVGPRPDRPYLAELFSREVPYYDLRYSVKPGLTGWAQIHYPYGATVENTREKLGYDFYYLRNFSFLLDLIIMIKTTRTVIFRLGR
jgi:lipopolysaccharide/colanic/teichoic acid biosynthesis glycosyltransferase